MMGEMDGFLEVHPAFSLTTGLTEMRGFEPQVWFADDCAHMFESFDRYFHKRNKKSVSFPDRLSNDGLFSDSSNILPMQDLNLFVLAFC